MRLYEAMFIVDSSQAERDWDGAAGEIQAIIAKHGGKVVDFRKWDDRRFAYEIKRMKRGAYALVHFEAPTLSIEAMRRDFVICEKIVRQLITVDADGVPTGDERPGITSTAIPDFPDRSRGRDSRPSRRGDDSAADDGVDADAESTDADKTE